MTFLHCWKNRGVNELKDSSYGANSTDWDTEVWTAQNNTVYLEVCLDHLSVYGPQIADDHENGKETRKCENNSNAGQLAEEPRPCQLLWSIGSRSSYSTFGQIVSGIQLRCLWRSSATPEDVVRLFEACLEWGWLLELQVINGTLGNIIKLRTDAIIDHFGIFAQFFK